MMRRALALIVAVLTGLLSSAALADDDPWVGTGQVSVGVVAVGEAVTFGGSGFAPHSSVRITSEGVTTGSVSADAAGSFRARVPGVFRPGFRALAGTGRDRAGRGRIVTVTVRVVASGARAAHAAGSPHSTGLALLCGFALVAVLSLGRVLVARRRALAWS
jgi:hypothetical protein